MGTEKFSAYIKNLKSDFRRAEKVLGDAPGRIMGNECVNVVKENFDLQGYDSGFGVEKWEERKESTNKAYDRGKTMDSRGRQSRYRTGKNSTFKGSVYSSQNPIMEQTRNLKNSVNKKAIGRKVMIGVLSNNLGPVLQYAEKMNEGGNGTPARQYMPRPSQAPNQKMLRNIRKKLDYELGKAFISLKHK
jgi:hypothetical protein